MGDQFGLCRDRPLIHRGIPACHRFLSEGPVRRLVVHLAFANFALGVFVAAAFPWPDFAKWALVKRPAALTVTGPASLGVLYEIAPRCRLVCLYLLPACETCCFAPKMFVAASTCSKNAPGVRRPSPAISRPARPVRSKTPEAKEHKAELRLHVRQIVSDPPRCVRRPSMIGAGL